MRVEIPKERDWSDEILERGIEFHGRGGPFMVLGIRMGLIALERLDAYGWFDLHCLAKLRWVPPYSCVLDGIQISSGCTLGKHNIDVKEQDGITVEFTKDKKLLKICLREEILEKIRGVLALKDEDRAKLLISELIEAPEREIFIISSNSTK